jgi:hypothetical protein
VDSEPSNDTTRTYGILSAGYFRCVTNVRRWRSRINFPPNSRLPKQNVEASLSDSVRRSDARSSGI